ncbi:MAG: hypothetical protein ACFB11_00675 [Paracoccaceae bacterium]
MGRVAKNGVALDVLDQIEAQIAIRRQFTVRELTEVVAASEETVRCHLQKLREKQAVRICGKSGSELVYSAFDKQKLVELDAESRKTARGASWTAMRMLRRFTPEDVMVAVSDAQPQLTVSDISSYCETLRKIGYLRQTTKARNGQSAAYVLVKNTGPLPPEKRRVAAVFDPNEDRYVWASGGAV